MVITALIVVIAGSGVSHAEDLCDEPIREFTGGHGRRPGPTIVKVEMRQTIRNSDGKMVSANSDDEIANIEGDEVTVLVDVQNSSQYDVAGVIINHAYNSPRPGPEMESIVSVIGGTYDSSSKTFRIELIPGGETVQLSFRIFLHGNLREGVSQTKLTLEDFYVLGSDRRFPQRTPESTGRNRQNVERVGIGGKEVSCFSGSANIAYVEEVANGSIAISAYNPPVEYEAYTAPVPPAEPSVIAQILMPPPVSADVQISRGDVRRSGETPEEVIVPQTGVEMGDLFMNLLIVLFGVVIGVLIYGMSAWRLLRSIIGVG
jgi:hypothetical protein